MDIFSRNIPSISAEEQAILKTKKAVVIGCGGIGGYIVEYLSRLGVGQITVCDGDKFDETNLNRQLLSDTENIGKSKAFSAADRVKKINPDAEAAAFDEFFAEDNADEILNGADVVLDALDNIPSRLYLEEKCAEKGLTIVHGAVSGWNGQIAVIPPKSGILKKLYSFGANEEKSCLSFTPAFCASIQSAEALKILCGRKSTLEGKILAVNLLSMDFQVIEL